MSEDTKMGRVLSMEEYRDAHAPTLSNDEAPDEQAIFEMMFGLDALEPYEPTPEDEALDTEFDRLRARCVELAHAEREEIDEELHHDAGDTYCLISLELLGRIMGDDS